MDDGRAANVRRPKHDWQVLLIDVIARPEIFGGGNDKLNQESIIYHKEKKVNQNTNTIECQTPLKKFFKYRPGTGDGST